MNRIPLENLMTELQLQFYQISVDDKMGTKVATF